MMLSINQQMKITRSVLCDSSGKHEKVIVAPVFVMCRMYIMAHQKREESPSNHICDAVKLIIIDTIIFESQIHELIY